MAQNVVGKFLHAPSGERQKAQYKAGIICNLALFVSAELQKIMDREADSNYRLCLDCEGELMFREDGAFRSIVLNNLMVANERGTYPAVYSTTFCRDYVRISNMTDGTVQRLSYEDTVVFLLRWLFIQVFSVETAHMTFPTLCDGKLFPRLEALMQSLFFPGVDVGAKELQRMLGLSYDPAFLCEGIEALGLNDYTYNALIELFKPVTPSVAMLATLRKNFFGPRFGHKSNRDLSDKLGKNGLTMGMKFPTEVVEWLKARGVTLSQL
jgi:hypothetical protein